MSKKRDWKGTEPVARTAEQWEKRREWEAMSPEEKRAAQRKQFISWLDMFQGDTPIMHLNGKPQSHSPMLKEAADLHLALFDKEIEPTLEVRIQLAQLELFRFPESKRLLYKYWKLEFPYFFQKNP